MNLADILKEIGNEGIFQIVAMLALAMPKMPIQWSMTMMSYAAYEPEWCCVPQHIEVNEKCVVQYTDGAANVTVLSYRSTYQHCDLNTTICSRHVYLDPDGASTAVTEWDLICDRQWIVSSLSSVQMGGVLVGALLSGSLSDVFGRKKVHFVTILVHALLNLGAGFSNSWLMFGIFRFFIGAAIGAYLVVHVPYILEFMSPRWRVIPASLPFGAIGASLLPLAAWLLPDWRWMHFICAIFCVPFLFAYFFLPESMRWLTVKGKVDEAAKVIDQIAKWNSRIYDPIKCYKKMQRIAKKEKELMLKGKKYSYLDVYRGWKMARLTLTLQFVWFTTSLVGYGIILGISSLAGNVYLNMFLVEAVEIPFIMATSYFSNCIGRRWTALIYFALGTLTAFLAFLFHLLPDMPNRDMSITIMCICCRTFVAGAAAVFIVVSTEVYPTVIRTLGYGACNTAAKVGGVLAPFVINMDSIPTVAYTIMFVTCLLCVIAVITLAETKNLLMEDTMEKTGSILSLMASDSLSFEQTSSAPQRVPSAARIIIDYDTDLIHHRSYSEFEDDDVDVDEDDVQDVVMMEDGVGKEEKKKKKRKKQREQKDKGEKTQLVGAAQHAAYDTFSGSQGKVTDDLSDSYRETDIDRADVMGSGDYSSGLTNMAFTGDNGETATSRQRPMFYMSPSVSVEESNVTKEDEGEEEEKTEETNKDDDVGGSGGGDADAGDVAGAIVVVGGDSGGNEGQDDNKEKTDSGAKFVQEH